MLPIRNGKSDLIESIIPCPKSPYNGICPKTTAFIILERRQRRALQFAGRPTHIFENFSVRYIASPKANLKLTQNNPTLSSPPSSFSSRRESGLPSRV